MLHQTIIYEGVATGLHLELWRLLEGGIENVEAWVTGGDYSREASNRGNMVY